MIKTAESVSLGHPDKIADYITSYILDRFIEHDAATRYAVEVMIKDNTVVLGGEVCSQFTDVPFAEYVKEALREIGYNEEYAQIWQDKAVDVRKLEVINLIGKQSGEIAAGVDNNGWGDQGVYIGYACQGEGYINRELYLARKLNRALYAKALDSRNLGLDIKTQITVGEGGEVLTAIAAVPMLEYEDLHADICRALETEPPPIPALPTAA